MDDVVLNRLQLYESVSFAAYLRSGCRRQFATAADEYLEVLNAAVGPALAFDRVKVLRGRESDRG